MLPTQPGVPAEARPKTSGKKSAKKPAPNPATDRVLRDVAALLADNRAEDALAILREQRTMDDPRRNARAVCLLRLGRYEAAGQVLAEIVVQEGSLVLQHDVPTTYLVNFATSLFLSRDVGETLRFLTEVAYEGYTDPRLDALRETIRAWKRSLPWSVRLRWFWSGKVPQPTLPDPPGFLE